MPIKEGLSSDSTERRSFGMFIPRWLATNLAVQRAPRYTRTSRLDPDGASSSSSNPAFPLVSDLNDPAAQARMAAKKS